MHSGHGPLEKAKTHAKERVKTLLEETSYTQEDENKIQPNH